VQVNQQLPPVGFVDQNVSWSTLGDFTVAGGSLTVKLSNNANGSVIADAVRIELVSPMDHIDVPAPLRPVSVGPVAKTPTTIAPVWSTVPIAVAKRPKPVAAPRRHR
jgi:hypothetical protein